MAFSISSFTYASNSFLDGIPSVPPNSAPSNNGKCYIQKPTVVTYENYDGSACNGLARSWYSSNSYSQCTLIGSVSVIDELTIKDSYSLFKTRFNCLTGAKVSEINISSFAPYAYQSQNYNCPPDASPKNTYSYDSDLDGKTDKCLNPVDINTASNCLAAPKSLPLWSGAPTSQTACVNQSGGGQCGYSLSSSSGSFVRDSSVQCFDDEKPPVNPPSDTPTPPSGQCLTFGSGYVCSANPADVCTANKCPDGCGWQSEGGATSFANGGGQFVCFTSTPNLPPKATNPNGNTDPDAPPPVAPSDESNPLSKDIAATTNKLGDLITLTRDKANDLIYAIDNQTGDLLSTSKQTNDLLSDLKSQFDTNPSEDGLVAAVDRATGEVISVMRESQVKLANIDANVFLTKDIQQGILASSQETKTEIVKGFDNVIEFMKTVDTPDPETGESPMDKLARTNSDGFAEVQRLLDELLKMPGIESAGGGAGSGLPTDPDTGEEVVPDAPDFRFDSNTVQIAPDSTAIDAKIDNAKASFISKINEIKTLITQKFSVDFNGAGGLPSLGVIEYDTLHQDVSLQPYAEPLSWIGLALIFMATVTGLFIIFR